MAEWHAFQRLISILCRKDRYEKVLQHLGAKRKIHTLIEELKLISRADESVPGEGVVTAPVESSKRSPVILFIGGGMGAGKSTVVKEIISRSGLLVLILAHAKPRIGSFFELDMNLYSFCDGILTSIYAARFGQALFTMLWWWRLMLSRKSMSSTAL